MPTAVLFDPYLDTLGGGERYVLTVAEILSNQGWTVDLAWYEQSILSQSRQRFGLKLNNVTISPEYFKLFSQKKDLLTRHQALNNLDLVFIVSDGSIPIMFGKKTILHYQVPFTKINQFPILNKLKLLSVNKIVVNSQFTKSIIDQTLQTSKSVVLYPPVDTQSFTPSKNKEKIILNVGRFTSPSHSKRQDILISGFIQLVDQHNLKDWRLVLAGGQQGDETNLQSFRKQAQGYPIDFVINPNFDSLKKLYAKSTLYWHAAGFEVDEKINPEAVEHFGITTVEAMSAGSVPIVHAKGGQKEIVTSNSGVLWDTIDQLVSSTYDLIKHPKKLQKFSTQTQIQSQKYNLEGFEKQLLNIIS